MYLFLLRIPEELISPKRILTEPILKNINHFSRYSARFIFTSSHYAEDNYSRAESSFSHGTTAPGGSFSSSDNRESIFTPFRSRSSGTHAVETKTRKKDRWINDVDRRRKLSSTRGEKRGLDTGSCHSRFDRYVPATGFDPPVRFFSGFLVLFFLFPSVLIFHAYLASSSGDSQHQPTLIPQAAKDEAKPGSGTVIKITNEKILGWATPDSDCRFFAARVAGWKLASNRLCVPCGKRPRVCKLHAL